MRLTVKQLKQKVPGSGMAIIDREAISSLSVNSGDFLEIHGRDGKDALARVWPSDTSDAPTLWRMKRTARSRRT